MGRNSWIRPNIQNHRPTDLRYENVRVLFRTCRVTFILENESKTAQSSLHIFSHRSYLIIWTDYSMSTQMCIVMLIGQLTRIRDYPLR